jgi:hypothetical protein
MIRTPSGWSAGRLLVLGMVVGASAFGAEPTPDEVLKARGLKKSGLLYVLDGESDFLAKLGKLQPNYRHVKELHDKLAVVMQNQYEYDQLYDQWTLVEERLRNVQAEIDTHPPLNNNELRQHWYDLLDSEKQLRFQYNELRREVNLRYRKLVSKQERENLSNEFQDRREDFLKESRALRGLADKAKEKYNALSKDDAVKKAIGELRLTTKARVDLGPSAEFKRGSAWLMNAERTTSPESFLPKARRKNARIEGNGKSPSRGNDRKAKSPSKGTRASTPASGEPEARPK